MTKTCGECCYYEHPAGQCSKVIEYNNCHITDKACEYFEPKPITNGDKIIADGIEAWLNAPADCVKQNGDHDTQTALSKADKAESEGGDE